jgi:hypothetical protein
MLPGGFSSTIFTRGVRNIECTRSTTMQRCAHDVREPGKHWPETGLSLYFKHGRCPTLSRAVLYYPVHSYQRAQFHRSEDGSRVFMDVI